MLTEVFEYVIIMVVAIVIVFLIMVGLMMAAGIGSIIASIHVWHKSNKDEYKDSIKKTTYKVLSVLLAISGVAFMIGGVITFFNGPAVFELFGG